MNASVEWTEQALRDLRRLDRRVAKEVIDAVNAYAETQVGDVRRLSGYTPPQSRLRVRDWRVRFRMSRAANLIEVIRVLRRDEAYRR